MRRSSSMSHIPIRGDRPRSRSTARTSTKESSKKVRPGSSDRLAVPLQRSNSLQGVAATPTLFGVRKYSSKKSNLVTPQMSYGFKRSNSNLATPSSARSTGRSPYKVGLDSAAKDKAWLSMQSAKLIQFLQEVPNCDEYIAQKLKPPITINTFVLVMQTLLKELHPHLEEMNTTNYKEVVLRMLKVFHYPGTVSNSLLKTVNTRHAWPQVVCIFAWLVDLATIVRRVNLPPSEHLADNIKHKKFQCIINYIGEKYVRYNNDEEQDTVDAKFQKEFAEILGVDDEENGRLEEEVKTLQKLGEQQKKKILEQEKKNESIKKKIEALQRETHDFYANKDEKQKELDCKIAALKEHKEKLQNLIKAKRESVMSLKKAIKQQPCTIQEKKRIESHIAEMKHTIGLKKEKAKIQKSLKIEYDQKLAAVRIEVENEVYRLNTGLMKLALQEPELKILKLKETDFLSEEFDNNIQNFLTNIKVFENKYRNELTLIKSTISEIDSKNSALDSQIESMKAKLLTLNSSEISLKKEIQKHQKNMEQMFAKREEDKKKFAQEIKQMKEKQLNLKDFTEQLKELTDLRNNEAAALETKKEETLEFFVKLHDITVDYVGSMVEIRNSVFNKLKQALLTIQENQEKILKDLHELEEITE